MQFSKIQQELFNQNLKALISACMAGGGALMNSNPSQQELFDKNFNILNNTLLKENLSKIKESKFELIVGKDSLDINLKNKEDNTFLYENTINELNSMLNIYNDKYLLYPVLYFYGFGNGILFKALLQNKHLKHIVVFEKDLEILWMMFHILDFSKELENNRLMIIDANLLDKEFYGDLCSTNPFFHFSRTYFLELTSNYYEKFQEDILEVNKNLIESFKNAILLKGNNSTDALQGIEQFVYNLPIMLSHPSYQDLILQRKNLSNTAIIVSTGPSLTKQLPLLKKYQNKATIIAADASYPILAKHNIKPDYVFSLERIFSTSKFFDNDFGDFDKDILFITTHLTHPQTIINLEKNNRNFMLAFRKTQFVESLSLEKFGELVEGHSVANLAYGLAVFLGHKNIIFIGQDLAYADDGSSHPSEHIYGNFDAVDKNTINYELQTLAYGGEKLVYTKEVWNLFRYTLEKCISQTSKANILTYNCTEGGARIEGAIEKPFLWACENLLDKDLNKPFEKLSPLSKDKQDELLLKAYYRVYKSINHCKEFKKELEKDFESIRAYYTLVNDNEEYLNLAIKEIDNFKIKLEDLKNMLDLYEILGPLMTQFELNLARIYVLNPKTKEDAYNKSVLWIKEHMEFLQMVYGHIEAQELALLKNILPLEEELSKRNLGKWMEMVKEKNG